jgi:hypothetical protein
MITILADHNIEGQALLLWAALSTGGWLDLVELRLFRFAEVGLDTESSDRVVWRFAQAQQMMLLTGNRNRKGEDSLEQTINEETTATTLPVLTIGRVDSIPQKTYREKCALRLMEIVMDLDNYRGVARVYLP